VNDERDLLIRVTVKGPESARLVDALQFNTKSSEIDARLRGILNKTKENPATERVTFEKISP
jgi:hypothetical protein